MTMTMEDDDDATNDDDNGDDDNDDNDGDDDDNDADADNDHKIMLNDDIKLLYSDCTGILGVYSYIKVVYIQSVLTLKTCFMRQA